MNYQDMKTWSKLKCTLLSQRRQSEPATHCKSATIGHPGKVKIRESKKTREEEHLEGWNHSTIRNDSDLKCCAHKGQ